MFSTDADIFFEEPNKCPGPSVRCGILHVLRRDISKCMGIDPSTREVIPKTLFPGVMAIFAGIDLLAKFHAGSDETGKVGKRFKSFISTYFKPISADDPETILQLRNSLLHSFGLYSCSKVGKKNKEYYFSLGENLSDFILVSGDVYKVDIQELYRRFEKAVLQYKTDIENDVSGLRSNFENMFPKYGFMSYIMQKSKSKEIF